MIVSRRGDAAQISSTLMSPPRGLDLLGPRCRGAPGASPLWRSTWVKSRSRATTPGPLTPTLGSMTSSRRGPHPPTTSMTSLVGPRGVPAVDPHAQHPVVPGEVAHRGDHLGPGRRLLARRHRVLQVEEGHVGDRGRGLGEEAVRGAGRRQARPARQVPAAARHAGEPTPAGLDPPPRPRPPRSGRRPPLSTRDFRSSYQTAPRAGPAPAGKVAPNDCRRFMRLGRPARRRDPPRPGAVSPASCCVAATLAAGRGRGRADGPPGRR